MLPMINRIMERTPQILMEKGSNKSTNIYKAPFHQHITHIAGFTNLITPPKNIHAAQIYSRSLFASGNGYPMWLTTLGTNLPDPYKKRGVCIGDVGVLAETGRFSFAFNVFLPSDHPINSMDSQQIPQGFVPLDPPDDSELFTIPGYFSPGSVVLSKGVEATRLSDAPLHLKLSSSEPEAAYLILPDGASRQDILTPRINEYLKEHAQTWIRHFEYYAGNGYLAQNGALYIVTGHDKAKTYSMVSFPSPLARGTGHRKVSAEYVNGQIHPNNISSTLATSQDSPENSSEIECVFLRGIRIGLNDWDSHFQKLPEFMTPVAVLPHTPPLSDLLKCIEDDNDDDDDDNEEDEDEDDSNENDQGNNDKDETDDDNNQTSAKSQGHHIIRGTYTGDQTQGTSSVNDKGHVMHETVDADGFHDEFKDDVSLIGGGSLTSRSNDDHGDRFIDDSPIPQRKLVTQYIFHPSDIVSQVMLFECPQAKIAFVDDHIWSIFSDQYKTEAPHNIKAPLTSRCSVGGFVSDFSILLETLFQLHDIVETDGVLSLVRNSKKAPSVSNQYKPQTTTKTTQKNSWLTFLQKKVWPRRHRAPNWAVDLISDLVRQGDILVGDEEYDMMY